jgi:PAS domain S-box-containing protein
MTSKKKLEEKNILITIDKARDKQSEVPVSLNLEDSRRLLQELKLREIELEFLNEELNRKNEAISSKLKIYSDYFNHSASPVVLLNADGKIASANQAFSRFLNLSGSNLEGKDLRNFLSAEFSVKLETILLNTSKNTLLTFVNSDGTTIEARTEIQLSPDKHLFYLTFIPQGQPIVNEIVAHDEQIYRAIGESINYGIWVCAPDGRNIYASDSFLKLVGMTQEQCSDFGWGDVLHPDDKERTIAAWKDCVQTGGIWDIEHRYRGIDKKWYHVLARGVPVKNKNGEITCWAGINLDITELKNIQFSLKESKDRYKILFESMPIGLAISDTSGKIIYGNHKSQSLLGINRSEIAHGIDISRWKFVRRKGSVITPTDVPDMKEYYMSQVIENIEIGIVDEANQITWLNVTSAPLQNHNEILIAFIDITEKIERENQLKMLSENFQELNATKDKFFSIIAHDLKNPFNSILGFSELMLKNISKYSIDEIERFVGIIHSTSKNAYNLLENLLNWSRTQTGTIEFSPNQYNLNEIIINNLDFVKNYALKKNIRFKYEPSGKLIVNIDKNMIDTVLRNLLTNSIKFSYPGEKVTITVTPEDHYYKISIRDYGIGIEPENMDKLFRIDSKYSSYGTNQEKGSGLGLIISKEFIERNRGTILAKSEFGKGSEFIFTLPKAE